MFRSFRKIKKGLVFGITLLLFSTVLTGCGGDNNTIIMNDDGTMKAFTEDQLVEGMYVKKGDTFYPLLNLNPATKDGTLAESDNFVWYTSFDQLVPEFNLAEGDKLIFYNESIVPTNFSIWKMTDQNYSVGIKFEQDEEGNLTFPPSEEGYCKYSPVYEYVNATVFSSQGTPRIKELNGTEFRETLLTPDGFLKGLTKDAMYRFYYYQGTVYKYVNIKADTHIFVEDYNRTTSSYVELKAKVFEINLPTDMENGYWLFDGYGLFYYKGPSTDLIEDESSTNVIPDEELNSMENEQSTPEQSQDLPAPEVPSEPEQPEQDEQPIEQPEQGEQPVEQPETPEQPEQP